MWTGAPAATTAGEMRVAVTPETTKTPIAQGRTILMRGGAGVRASATDEA